MNAQSMIEIYRIGFYASGAVAALGLGLAIIFFFRFHIRSIWAIRTGKAQREAVKALQQASRNDGRMRKDEKFRELSTEEMAGSPIAVTDPLEATTKPPCGQTEVLPQDQQGFDVVSDSVYGVTNDLNPERTNTTILGPSAPPDFGNTSDLGFGTSVEPGGNQQIGETTVLCSNEFMENGNDFSITQDVVLIHTTEMIPG